MAHMGSSMGQYSQDMQLLNSGAISASYRSGSYPGGVGSKGYYVGPEWGDAYGADGGVDYGLSCPSYQIINNDPVHMGVSYGQWAQVRQKGANQGGSVYMDPDSGYTYGAGATTSLVHRPAVSAAGDTSAYSFSSIAASLPATSNERLLPTPISRALGSSSSNYRAEGLASGYGAPKPGHGPSVSSAATGQSSPVSPISDAAAAAVVVSYAGAAYDYATSARSSQHHGGSLVDAYTSVPSGTSETIFGDSERNATAQGSAVDLTAYAYGGTSPAEASSMRRSSSGSGLTSRSAPDGSNNVSGYVGTDGEASTVHAAGQGSGPHTQSSSSTHGQKQRHGQHPPHYHHTSSRHASPRRGRHHRPQ